MSISRQHYDVVIIGACGLFGSSAFYHAAKTAAMSPKNSKLFMNPRVLGIEQFEPGHTNGSSHGESRITRLATGEGAEYVRLAQRSHELWSEIEEKTEKKFGQLCHLTGGLIIASDREIGHYHGSEKGFLQQTRHCAKEFKIAHENLTAADLRDRFPQYNVEDSESGYFEHSMGFINPGSCIKAQLDLARQYGGELHTGEKLKQFKKISNGIVEIVTDRGIYHSKKLILATGAWTPQLLAELLVKNLNIYRQTVYWFEVEEKARANYSIGKFPPFIWDGGKKGIIYGFPIMEGNYLKIGSEKFLEKTTPQSVDRTVHKNEIKEMFESFIKPNFKGITKNCVKAIVCLYTVAPKHRFIIDYLPDSDNNIIVISACSGHGAKHSAAVGEAVAQLSLLGKTNINVINIFGGLRCIVANQESLMRARL
jgi:sarcosine oxidase